MPQPACKLGLHRRSTNWFVTAPGNDSNGSVTEWTILCELARRPDRPVACFERPPLESFHPIDLPVAAERILALHADDEVEGLVEHLRKRVRGVESDRPQTPLKFCQFPERG